MLGWAGKITGVDLATGTGRRLALPGDFYQQWLGGPGFNTALYAGQIPGFETLAGEAVSFAVGPLGGSPLMGANAWAVTAPDISGAGLATAFGTGNWGVTLKLAGLDQVVIWGSARRPAYLVLNEEECYLKEMTVRGNEPQESVEQGIKEDLGDPEAATLTFASTGITSSRGLVCGSPAAGQLLARRNLLAIVIQGRGSIDLADSDMVLAESCRAVARWRETGLAGGNNGCLACHGGCRPAEDQQAGGPAPGSRYSQVAVSLWLAAGVCPLLITSGASPWAGADLEKLLAAVTGCNFTTAGLWAIAHCIQKADTALQAELRGPVC